MNTLKIQKHGITSDKIGPTRIDERHYKQTNRQGINIKHGTFQKPTVRLYFKKDFEHSTSVQESCTIVFCW